MRVNRICEIRYFYFKMNALGGQASPGSTIMALWSLECSIRSSSWARGCNGKRLQASGMKWSAGHSGVMITVTDETRLLANQMCVVATVLFFT